MIRVSGEGHIGSAFSIVEILIALYYHVARVIPAEPDWPDRDRIVLSKGHGCGALYAVLADRGFFPVTWFSEFLSYQTRLAGHPDMRRVPGIDISTGSLGHGVSAAVGIALAGKCAGRTFRTFVIAGDGELNEGMTWEALLVGAHLHLVNLTLIVDRNRMQVDGDAETILGLEPLADKLASFGWEVRTVDGHNVDELRRAFGPAVANRPVAVVARTLKGKGVSFMEQDVRWHYRAPSDAEFEKAFAELRVHTT